MNGSVYNYNSYWHSVEVAFMRRFPPTKWRMPSNLSTYHIQVEFWNTTRLVYINLSPCRPMFFVNSVAIVSHTFDSLHCPRFLHPAGVSQTREAVRIFSHSGSGWHSGQSSPIYSLNVYKTLTTAHKRTPTFRVIMSTLRRLRRFKHPCSQVYL